MSAATTEAPVAVSNAKSNGKAKPAPVVPKHTGGVFVQDSYTNDKGATYQMLKFFTAEGEKYPKINRSYGEWEAILLVASNPEYVKAVAAFVATKGAAK